jgi:MoxR-like ATPase
MSNIDSRRIALPKATSRHSMVSEHETGMDDLMPKTRFEKSLHHRHRTFLPGYRRRNHMFEAAASARLPVMLKGPTGCGKTRFVEHMAFRLKRP